MADTKDALDAVTLARLAVGGAIPYPDSATSTLILALARAVLAMAEARTAEQERADVVAWLRTRAEMSDASARLAVERHEVNAHAIHTGKSVSLRFAADAIELGEHLGAAQKRSGR